MHTPIFLSSWSLRKLLFSRKLSLVELARFAGNAGFNGIEINDTFLFQAEPRTLSRLIRAINLNQLQVTLAASNDFTVADPQELRAQINRIKTLIGLGSELSATGVRLFASGKSALARYFWKNEADNRSTPAVKNSNFTQKIFHFLLRPEMRATRELVTHYFFAQRKMKPKVLNQIISATQSLLPLAEQKGVTLAFENHGGFSASPENLIFLIKKIDDKKVGLCPDFGNFLPFQDRYKSLEKMLPYAKSIHAKSYKFDRTGNETTIDYQQCFQLIKKTRYQGPIVVEYEGTDEAVDGVNQTLALIRKFIKT